MPKPVQYRLHGDFLSWERHYLDVFLKALETRGAAPAGERLSEERPLWIVTRDPRGALQTVPKGFRPPVFISVLAFAPAPRFLGLFPRNWNPRRDLDVRWIAHSDFTYRSLLELEGVATDRLIHLPFPGLMAETQTLSDEGALRVGFLSALASDANLGFLVSVAHYVSRLRPEVRFRVPASGKLSEHLGRMTRDLGLEAMFENLDEGPHYGIGVLLFAPLKCEHFLPVLWSAGAAVPTLATDVSGIETLIADGHDGFILPVNEVKPVGELIVRLAEDPTLRRSLGARLRAGLAKRLPMDRLLDRYLSTFHTEPRAERPAVAA